MTRIFAEGELRGFLEHSVKVAKAEIEREEKSHFLNMNESSYIKFLVEKHQFEPINFYPENINASEAEEMISSDRFPRNFHVGRGQSYPRQVVTFYLPYTGFDDFLHLMPSNRILWTDAVVIANKEISFSFIVFDQGPEGINRQKDEFIRNIQVQAANSKAEVEAYNKDLENKLTAAVKERKATLLAQSNLIAGLGIPIRKRGGGAVPQTFSIPTVKQKVTFQKPQSSSLTYTPEPTLSDEIYKGILKICFDFGIQMERTPSLYEGKDEETLRDHLLLVLAPHFEFASGETFNKKGKTDILVRYQGKNAFVGECKFWKGDNVHSNTIDQILNYLTWRDSKAAILYFVENKQLDPVLKKIKELTPTHPCFIREGNHNEEAWVNYEFRLPNDETRSVKLAILVFHFPAA